MEFNETASRRKKGRPLSFDRDAALEKAMLTFWRYGYETTSIVDLTTAMGVSAHSLYTAFGNKKQLFLEAVRLYAGDLEAMGRAINSAPTSRQAAHELLTGAAIAYTGRRDVFWLAQRLAGRLPQPVSSSRSRREGWKLSLS